MLFLSLRLTKYRPNQKERNNMYKIGINSKGLSVFKKENNELVKRKNANPFQNSFKGKMLTRDVFVSSTIREHAPIEQIRTIFDTTLAHLSNTKEFLAKNSAPVVQLFHDLVDKTVSFARKGREMFSKVSKFEQIDFKRVFPKLARETEISTNAHEVKMLTQQPVNELRNMFETAIA